MERTVGYSWRGPHGRLDPLDQRSPAHARSLARPGTGPTAENPYDDTMSGVPTTEKCLLPRVVMRCPLLRVREGFPYVKEGYGEDEMGEVDAEAGARPLDEHYQWDDAIAPIGSR